MLSRQRVAAILATLFGASCTPSAAAGPAPALPVVAASPAVPAPPERGQAMLLLGDALVLDSAAEPAWSSAPIAADARPIHLVATRHVRWDSLPPPLRALAGAAVIVYDRDGVACRATVEAPRLHFEHDGFPYDRAGPDYRDGRVPPMHVLLDMLEETFKSADRLLLLATPRDRNGAACRGEWARRADLPAPAVFGRRPADRSRHTEVLALVGAQPEFAAVHASYLDHAGRAELPAWDEHIRHDLLVTEWHQRDGDRHIVSVELHGPSEPCRRESPGDMALLFEQRGDQLVRLPQPGWLDLVALMDIDRDGVLEAVTDPDVHIRRLEARSTALRDECWYQFDSGC